MTCHCGAPQQSVCSVVAQSGRRDRGHLRARCVAGAAIATQPWSLTRQSLWTGVEGGDCSVPASDASTPAPDGSLRSWMTGSPSSPPSTPRLDTWRDRAVIPPEERGTASRMRRATRVVQGMGRNQAAKRVQRRSPRSQVHVDLQSHNASPPLLPSGSATLAPFRWLHPHTPPALKLAVHTTEPTLCSDGGGRAG